MAKNTINTPIKDGVKADNSTYSSNKIHGIINTAAEGIIDDTSEGSNDSTYSSNKILELIASISTLNGVIIISKTEYDLIQTPSEDVLYIVLDLVNESGDGGGTGVYRYYYIFNGIVLNPNNADRSTEYDTYYENLFFNAGGSVYKSDNSFKFFSADDTSRDWTVVFKAHNWINTTKNMIGMSRTSAPCWYIENAGNASDSTLYLKGDTTESSQTLNLGNIQDKEVKLVKASGELKVYIDGELLSTLTCVMSSNANSDWFRIGAVTSSGSTFNGVFEYVGAKWDS